VPTLRDLGYTIEGDSWFGLSGPAGIAPDITMSSTEQWSTYWRCPTFGNGCWPMQSYPSR
jgi:hypothetical protein